jgi:hypothetical protein
MLSFRVEWVCTSEGAATATVGVRCVSVLIDEINHPSSRLWAEVV